MADIIHLIIRKKVQFGQNGHYTLSFYFPNQNTVFPHSRNYFSVDFIVLSLSVHFIVVKITRIYFSICQNNSPFAVFFIQEELSLILLPNFIYM